MADDAKVSSPTAAPVAPAEVATAIVLGFVALGVVNAVVIAGFVPLPAGGVRLRALHHVYDFAETVGVGVVVAGVIGLFLRLVRLPTKWLYGIGFVAAVGMIYAVIGEYLALQSEHALSGRFVPIIFANDFLLLGGAFVAGPVLAWRCASLPRLRFLPTAVGVAVLVGDHIPLRDDYFGVHCLIAFGGTLLVGPPLVPYVRRAIRGAGRTVAVGALVLVAVFGLAVAPGNAIRQQLFRQPLALAPWVLATLYWRAPQPHRPVILPPSPWLEDRSHAPPVPATPRAELPALPRDLVVVLLTVDATRAEAILDPTHDARFPMFARMKREGVSFTHATSPGAQTPTSLSALFSGRYYSELRWANHGEGMDRFPYPATDATPRFPELLSSHGVTTAQELAYVFLANDFGVIRGFQDETQFGKSRAAAPARHLVGPILEKVSRATEGPRFYYAHFGDPHAPYVYGREGQAHYERYLAAIAEVDRQIARITHALEEHCAKRWVLIVSADHGEAFGEHQTYDHSKTLYEELIHVPLLVLSPLFQAQVVDERVGLIDVGPTVLDLFGVDTPAIWNGQSLLPILAKADGPPRTRPLLAEGRLSKEYTQSDGFKVIDDPRRKVVETYDLAKDPGETRNLFDVEPDRSDAALAYLREFFRVHSLREPGYEPPYKP